MVCSFKPDFNISSTKIFELPSKIGTSKLSINISQLFICRPAKALKRCSTVFTSISFNPKLVENFVETTWSHLAGMIFPKSVLLKKIPEFSSEGLSVIFVLTPE